MQSRKSSGTFIEQCYVLYEQKMYYAAYAILKDEMLAEDAVQEAFLHLMKQKIFFPDAASDDCKRYIITIIKHVAIDMYRKKKRENAMMYLSEPEECDLIRQELNADEEKEEVLEQMKKLPEKYYAVVEAIAFRNLSVKEASCELGITEANVRKRFQRSKVMLKAMWKEG